MPKLCVNIDHVATLRQVRRGIEPEPVHAAGIAELAGADGITVHLREDRRHINERDVQLLRRVVKTKLNMEMSIADEIVKIALEIKPDQATLVPEKRQEVTTEGGLDVILSRKSIRQVVERLQRKSIIVSLFIAPEFKQVDSAKNVMAEFIELNTGRYADSKNERERMEELDKLKESAAYAHRLGLRINAGHGLNYQNVTPVAHIPYVEELNIGHAIISRAVFVGLSNAVREMKELIS